MKSGLLAGAALLAMLPAHALAQTTNPDPNRNGGQDSPASAAAPAAQGRQPESSATPEQASPAPDQAVATDQGVPAEQPTATPIDTLEPAEGPIVAATPAPTGNPVLDRLNALEAKVAALEARNKELEDEAASNRARLESVEVRSAKAVQFGWAPTFSEPTGNFTFKVRGVLDIDYAGYRSRDGGYDYSNGTQLRRDRFGVDGTAFKVFGYRLEAEYVGNTANILDAYLSYTGIKNWVFTIGQQKAPYGLEANTSDNFNEFLERGMANTAFGAVGAERRIGATVAYVSDRLNATVGVFGVNEAIGRNAVTPDEGYGFNGRLTFDPILEPGRVVHLGVSGYRATNFAANSVTVADRPNVRVDDGRIVSAVIAGTNPVVGPHTGAKDATFIGGEAAVVFGPFSVQGEYDRLNVERYGAKTAKFDGFYGFASFFITGESRVFKNGVVDRLKPISEFNPQKGNWGAFEIAARYDRLDLTDHDLSPLNKRATSWTGALNWYLNGNVKVLFNYIRFKGTNSPLVVAPVAVNGTTAKGEAFATRLHLDF